MKPHLVRLALARKMAAITLQGRQVNAGRSTVNAVLILHESR